jgi:hypothetical protein
MVKHAYIYRIKIYYKHFNFKGNSYLDNHARATGYLPGLSF